MQEQKASLNGELLTRAHVFGQSCFIICEKYRWSVDVGEELKNEWKVSKQSFHSKQIVKIDKESVQHLFLLQNELFNFTYVES